MTLSACVVQGVSEKAHGPTTSKVTVTMKDLGFETVKEEKDKPKTVLSSLKDTFTLLCTTVEKILQDSDTYMIFQGLDAVAM